MGHKLKKGTVLLSEAGFHGLNSMWFGGAFDKDFRTESGRRSLPLVIERVFSIVELFCLFDRVLLVTNRRDNSNQAAPHPYFYHDPLLQTAQSAGILEILTEERIKDTLPEELRRFRMKGHEVANQAGLWHREYEDITSHFLLASSLGLPMAVMPDMEPAFETVAEVLSPVHLIQPRLKDACKKLAIATSHDLKELEEYGLSQEVRIPPIPALILSECRLPEDIPDKTVSLRDSLKGTRRAFASYEETVRNDDLPLGRRLGAKRKLDLITSELAAPFGAYDATMISEWRDLSMLLGEQALETDKLARILFGKPLSLVAGLLRRLRVLRLYQLKKRFFRIRRFANLLPDVFGVEISEKDFAASRASVERADGLRRSGNRDVQSFAVYDRFWAAALGTFDFEETLDE